MRVTGGNAGGIPLKVPARVARPTTDRVREALFSILGASVEGAVVLDLFAGSGALGIEALSRGAERAVFVERDRQAASAIRENLKKARLEAKGKIVEADVFSWLRKSKGANSSALDRPDYDLAFADPPYRKDKNNEGQDMVHRLLSEMPLSCSSRLVLETEASRDFGSDECSSWLLEDERTYGSTRLWFFHRQGADSPTS